MFIDHTVKLFSLNSTDFFNAVPCLTDKCRSTYILTWHKNNFRELLLQRVFTLNPLTLWLPGFLLDGVPPMPGLFYRSANASKNNLWGTECTPFRCRGNPNSLQIPNCNYPLRNVMCNNIRCAISKRETQRENVTDGESPVNWNVYMPSTHATTIKTNWVVLFSLDGATL